MQFDLPNTDLDLQISPRSLKIYEKELQFQNLIFQPVDASVHNANIVKKFFKEEEREVLEWWANSSYLNAVKNLWV